jgi:hypothetical protein
MQIRIKKCKHMNCYVSKWMKKMIDILIHAENIK